MPCVTWSVSWQSRLRISFLTHYPMTWNCPLPRAHSPVCCPLLIVIVTQLETAAAPPIHSTLKILRGRVDSWRHLEAIASWTFSKTSQLEVSLPLDIKKQHNQQERDSKINIKKVLIRDTGAKARLQTIGKPDPPAKS